VYRIYLRKYLCLALCLFVLVSTGCFNPQGETAINKDVLPVQAPNVRKMGTPYYAGGGAVIFVMDQINDSSLRDIADRIIRVFGENNAPLNVAVAPLSREMLAKDLDYLTAYVDAGIIDISVDGTSVAWLLKDTSKSSTFYGELKSSLLTAREDLKYYFGESPLACIFPSEDFIEENYMLLQDAGFKVLCTENIKELNPSISPVNWAGEKELNGMYRLPVVGNIDDLVTPATRGASTNTDDPNKKLLSAVDQSLKSLGVAIIEIQPGTFLGRNKKLDTVKLKQLAVLIKSCRNLGEITTLEAWCKYESGLITATYNKNRVMPFYGGGTAVIFRLDDVSKEYNEEVVQEIIKVFQKNGVPLDLGIVSHANGTDSFEIPWVIEYFNEGVVGISVHGFDWTYFQIDTTRTYLNDQENNLCIDWTKVKEETTEPAPIYRDIKYNLRKARDQYLKYFGVSPVAFTVPTDYYDETGYRAVQDAGFKVFSTQSFVEPRPSSAYRVDFFGKVVPDGMYRIPTASDVCIWEKCGWGNIFDISKQSSVKDYCKYEGDWYDRGMPYNDFSDVLCGILGELGVAAIGLHPDCFLDRDSNIDRSKLEQLDTIIKWVKTFATITTFEQWYNYTEGKK
jgi:hypothetical protein